MFVCVCEFVCNCEVFLLWDQITHENIEKNKQKKGRRKGRHPKEERETEEEAGDTLVSWLLSIKKIWQTIQQRSIDRQRKASGINLCKQLAWDITATDRETEGERENAGSGRRKSCA